MSKKKHNPRIQLDDTETFFWDHAGYSYDQAHGETAEHGRGVTAILLASAERALKRSDAYVVWEPDPEPYDGDVPYDGPVWTAVLQRDNGRDGTEYLASLGGIACESDSCDYARVINAELALEAGL